MSDRNMMRFFCHLAIVVMMLAVAGCTSLYSHSYYEPIPGSIPLIEHKTGRATTSSLITPVEGRSFYFDYNGIRFEILAYETMKEDLILVGPILPVIPLGLFDLLFFPGTDDKTMTIRIYLPEEGAVNRLPAKIEMMDLDEGREIYALVEKISPEESVWSDARLIYLFGDGYPSRFSLSFVMDALSAGPLEKPAIVFERRYRPALAFSIWY